MKLVRTLILLALLAFSASSAFATIRTVSASGTAQFSSIVTAYNAASANDTILIGPGIYNETAALNLTRKNILIGAGLDVVTWNVTNGFSNITVGNNAAAGSIIEGIRIENITFAGSLFQASVSGADTITIRRCTLRAGSSVTIHNGSGGRMIFEDCLISNINASAWDHLIYAPTTASKGMLFRNCIFSYNIPNNSTAALHGANGGTIELYNCAFLNFNKVFNLTGTGAVVAINNVFYDWYTPAGATTYGTYLGGSTFDYTAQDNTGPTFPGTFTNTIALAANNPFVTYNTAGAYVLGTSDIHLNGGAGGLLLTNTGHPALLDLDASRSDLGIYGGTRPYIDSGAPAYPFASTLTIPSLIGAGDNVNVNSVGRIGPRY